MVQAQAREARCQGRGLAKIKTRPAAPGGSYSIVPQLSPGDAEAQACQASALIAADRRLLWRAALFLWMILLSAMLSMTDTDDWNT